jgi:undecaprenyl-diphosphatase
MTIVLIFFAAAIFLALEQKGLRTTLSLSFKGDIKRESQWVAQYGQGVCTVIAALLVWRLDDSHPHAAGGLLIAVFGTSLVATVIKRLVGRVRPNREQAGKFLGPTWRHANWRESFPSSHSAAAIAMSAYLANLYPPAAPIFWTLGILCALLRYFMDAHWPSDVLAGIGLGYAGALAAAQLI